MPLSYSHLTFPTTVSALVDSFDAVERDAGRLMDGLDDELFNRPPGPGAWSAAQCMDHLTATARAYVPAMESGLQRAGGGRSGRGEIRPAVLSRWFIRKMEPPVTTRFKAASAVVPSPRTSLDEGWKAFVAGNQGFREFARRCEGLDVNRVRFPNPFAPLRLTIATGLTLMVAHHRRHVCQMERAIQAATAARP